MTAALLFLGVEFSATAAEKAPPADPPAKVEDTNEAQQTLRSYLLLQEQLHSTLLTIERTRKEADAAAKANVDAITARLAALEQSLGAQQKNETSLLQDSNRATLVATGAFAGLGMLAMIFMAWFLWRAMSRLETVVAALPGGTALAHSHPGPLFSNEPPLANVRPVEQSSNRLLGVVDRLEKRVHDLEQTSHPSLPLAHTDPPPGPNGTSETTPAWALSERGSGRAAGAPEQNQADGAPRRVESPDRVSVILGKGQSLLSLDKPEEAIACFDEAIAIDAQNAEALVKKGTALERLKRLEEAIECYDRAIASNRTMTLAYLYKGGVCNQLERFNEALECYEHALRTQQPAGGE